MSDGVVFADRIVLTIRDHPCCWCSEVVDKGSRVRFRKYTWEGSVAQEWWHNECWAAMHHADIGDIEEGWVPGDHTRGGTVNVND